MFSSALKSFSSNITANYTISSNPSSTAGAWKVFDGKNKKTGKLVSVFVFDRKSLEPGGGGLRSRSNGSTRRKIHDEIVERLKKEASSLARLRHPNILELAEPVEDTRNGGLMFATEPITATLAGLLQNQDVQERGRGRARQYHGNGEAAGQEVEIDELEIQKGLLQVAKGLEFLHESAGLVHGNLTPEAIFVNQKSDWKLSGLAFSGPPDTTASSAPSSAPPIALSELLYYDPRLPKTVQLSIDYTSPDFVMDANISSAADMFSLGLLILVLYNSPHESPLRTGGNISTYKKLFSSSSTVPSTNNNFLLGKTLPRELVSSVLPRLITRRPAQRMSAREFQESRFFDSVLVSAIRFLESLPTKTPNEKSQFMRRLPRFLDQFPKSVLDKKVLPALLEEMKDRELLALILGNVFRIMTLLESAPRAFTDIVLPRLRETFVAQGSKATFTERDTAKEAGLVVLLEKMALIARICPGKGFKDDILPIIYIGLESPTHAVVDKALSCLSTTLGILDFSTIKNDLFPVVANVFSKTTSLAIKVRGLEAFVILCGGELGSAESVESKPNPSAILDKYTVQEKIVPLLKAIKTKEPAVMMAALNVFRQVGKIADCEFLAMDVLPILWSFSLGPLLNLQQFKEYMDLIKNLSSKIEQQQTRKLRNLASTSTNGFSTSQQSSDLMLTDSSDDPFSPIKSTSDAEFERLVFGKASSSNTSASANPIAAHPGPPTSPSFSWSSESEPTTSSILNRTMTPDVSHTLSSLRNARQPTTSSPSGTLFPTHSLQQPLQSISMASNPWANPPQASVRVQNTHSLNNAWGASQQQQPGIANGSWIKPTSTPPLQQSIGYGGFGSLSQPLQPVQRAGSFGVPLPPPPGTSFNLQGQQQPVKKTGLDAYESLI